MVGFFALIGVLAACDRSLDVVAPDARSAAPALSSAVNGDGIVIKTVTVPGADTLRGLARLEAEIQFDIDYLKNLKKQDRYGFHAVDKAGKSLTIHQVLGELEAALKHIKKRKAEKGNEIRSQCAECVVEPDWQGGSGPQPIEGNQDTSQEETMPQEDLSYTPYGELSAEEQYVVSNFFFRSYWTADYLTYLGQYCRELRANSYTIANGAYYTSLFGSASFYNSTSGVFKSAPLADGRFGGVAEARVSGTTCSHSVWDLIARATHRGYVGRGRIQGESYQHARG